MLRFGVVLTVWLLLAPATQAASWDDALAAYQAGEFESAHMLLLPLAESDHAEAQDILSDMHWYGEGVPVDLKVSLEWSMRSAALGSAEGHFGVAKAYEEGNGVDRDSQAARTAYERSVAAGGLKGHLALARLASAQGTEAGDRLAVSHLRQAAEGGLHQAQFMLAMNMMHGQIGLTPDADEELRLLLAAAEQRHTLAQVLLGAKYFGGRGVPRNLVQAIKWTSLALNDGCRLAGQIMQEMARIASPDELNLGATLAVTWEANHAPRDRRGHWVFADMPQCQVPTTKPRTNI